MGAVVAPGMLTAQATTKFCGFVGLTPREISEKSTLLPWLTCTFCFVLSKIKALAFFASARTPRWAVAEPSSTTPFPGPGGMVKGLVHAVTEPEAWGCLWGIPAAGRSTLSCCVKYSTDGARPTLSCSSERLAFREEAQ